MSGIMVLVAKIHITEHDWFLIQHMGCMKFKQRPREEQAEADETVEASAAAEMFAVDTEQLLMALVKPRVRVGNEWVSKGQASHRKAGAGGGLIS